MKVKSLAELNNQVKDESIALTNSGFTATLQSGTLSGDVVHTLPTTSGALVGGGDQTIAGIKTFSSSPVVPNATTGGQAIRYDQSVKLTGDETIAGIKTFSSSPIVPTPTTGTQAANKYYVDLKQANLGFTPVQQGTGIGQTANTVKIGWSTFNRVKVTVDATDIGNIVMDNDIGVANSSLVKTALNASGTAPIYACRAWVNFNGTGTVAIRGSGNVSSVADNGVGDYTVNFTTTMPDANYSTCFGGDISTAVFMGIQSGVAIPSTTSVRIRSYNGALASTDGGHLYGAIFR